MRAQPHVYAVAPNPNWSETTCVQQKYRQSSRLTSLVFIKYLVLSFPFKVAPYAISSRLDHVSYGESHTVEQPSLPLLQRHRRRINDDKRYIFYLGLTVRISATIVSANDDLRTISSSTDNDKMTTHSPSTPYNLQALVLETDSRTGSLHGYNNHVPRTSIYSDTSATSPQSSRQMRQPPETTLIASTLLASYAKSDQRILTVILGAKTARSPSVIENEHASFGMGFKPSAAPSNPMSAPGRL